MQRSSGPRWATMGAARTLWQRLAADLRAQPTGTWRRWFVTLLLGWLICAAISVTVTKLGQRWDPKWLRAWDERTLRAIEQGKLSFQNAILLESPGNLIYMIPLVACVAVVAIRWRRPMFAVTVVASYVLARTLLIVGWSLWDRPRPRLIADGIAAPPLNSYPSGHIMLAMSVYLPLAYAWGRGSRSNVERVIAMLLAVAWSSAAGYARVRLGSHWPSDVIAGGVIGLAWAAVVIVTLHRTDRPLAAATGV